MQTVVKRAWHDRMLAGAVAAHIDAVRRVANGETLPHGIVIHIL